MDTSAWAPFRRRVLEVIEEDLAREEREAEAQRAVVHSRTADVIERARAEGRCGGAWLFGSFAWGMPGARSDVDVLVERCEDPDALAADIWRATERPAHVVQRERASESLVTRALADGKPL
jgi:predicted nucleotidyltransferase